VFADVEGDLGEKGTIFLQLAEAKSSLTSEQRSDLLQKNIDMLTQEVELPYHSLLQRSYHALGVINKKSGNLQEALFNFKQGFTHELANEFPQYDDLNYNRLIDYYFSHSDFNEAINITRQRIKAVGKANKKWADEYSDTGVYEGSESLPVLQQTLAWLYFLNNDLELAVPIVDHLALQYLALHHEAEDFSATAEDYEYRRVEFVLDNIIMLKAQKRDAKQYQALLATMSSNELAKFKERCQDKKHRPLTAYRYSRYEAILK
jgi:tetratricopeptide (TPR) repeat protein